LEAETRRREEKEEKDKPLNPTIGS